MSLWRSSGGSPNHKLLFSVNLGILTIRSACAHSWHIQPFPVGSICIFNTLSPCHKLCTKCFCFGTSSGWILGNVKMSSDCPALLVKTCYYLRHLNWPSLHINSQAHTMQMQRASVSLLVQSIKAATWLWHSSSVGSDKYSPEHCANLNVSSDCAISAAWTVFLCSHRAARCHTPNTFGTVNMECTVDLRLSWSKWWVWPT